MDACKHADTKYKQNIRQWKPDSQNKVSTIRIKNTNLFDYPLPTRFYSPVLLDLCDRFPLTSYFIRGCKYVIPCHY
jgi:hypothetical protein